MTRRIALTGTDGTGKTTLVRALAARFANRPDQLVAFRAPQYHEHPDHPFGQLAASIDALSEAGDRAGDPFLKATALFLSMTLYGDVERHLAGAYAPAVLVGERQPLADSLVYASFYEPLITGPLDRARCEPLIEATLSPEAFARLQAWLPVFQARAPLGGSSFWDLPMYMKRLFALPPQQLGQALAGLYHVTPPDQVVLLTISPEALVARLAQKRGMSGAPPRELHEQGHVLVRFQEGLMRACEALRAFSPTMQITQLDTSDRTIDQTVAAVLREIGVEIAQP